MKLWLFSGSAIEPLNLESHASRRKQRILLEDDISDAKSDLTNQDQVSHRFFVVWNNCAAKVSYGKEESNRDAQMSAVGSVVYS
jgi:hypothetical protein